jgi:hypothetical protein
LEIVLSVALDSYTTAMTDNRVYAYTRPAHDRVTHNSRHHGDAKSKEKRKQYVRAVEPGDSQTFPWASTPLDHGPCDSERLHAQAISRQSQRHFDFRASPMLCTPCWNDLRQRRQQLQLERAALESASASVSIETGTATVIVIATETWSENASLCTSTRCDRTSALCPEKVCRVLGLLVRVCARVV